MAHSTVDRTLVIALELSRDIIDRVPYEILSSVIHSWCLIIVLVCTVPFPWEAPVIHNIYQPTILNTQLYTNSTHFIVNNVV